MSFNVLAPLLLSACTSSFTTGVVVVKAWQYFSCFPNDPTGFKWLVGLTVAHSVAVGAAWPSWPYLWMVQGFGSYAWVTGPVVNIMGNQSIGNVILMVQGFFAWRVWKLAGGSTSAKNYIFPAVIMLAAFTQWAAEIILTYMDSSDRKLADGKRTFGIGDMWAASSAAGGSMAYLLLYRNRKARGMARSEPSIFADIVKRLAELNLFSLVLQVAVILILQYGQGYWFLPFTSSVTQVYTFSLLSSLTSRSHRYARSGATNTRRTGATGVNKMTMDHGVSVTVERHERVDAEPEGSEHGGAEVFDVKFGHSNTGRKQPALGGGSVPGL